jgi:antitoxin (DNA-binding transcriptional repressor) of toxin-antitoxin stability system
MHSVNIAELKNNLSRYLEQAIAGEEIIIRDHDLAVARLAPMNGNGTATDELLKLAAEGKIRLGEGAIDDEYWKLKLPRVKSERQDTLQWLIDEERGR